MLHNTKISRKDAKTQRGTANANEWTRTEDGLTADDGAAPWTVAFPQPRDEADRVDTRSNCLQYGEPESDRSSEYVKRRMHFCLFTVSPPLW